MAALRIMSYLKQKQNYRFFLDPTYPVINKNTFGGSADWKEFYGNATKTIPHMRLSQVGKKLIFEWWLIVTM